MDWTSLLFSFHGRINRAKYWLIILIYVIVGLILGVIGLALGQGVAMQVLGGIVELVALVSSLAVATKRLHDRGKSAWWLLVFYLVPGVLTGIGAGIELSSGPMALGGLFTVVGLAVGIWAFVELGCLRGTIGPNPYGPDPLGPQAPATHG
ncbi:MAG TPA: DUF805 domain-containing protein [Xanthobacteraceae bacterium]|jgi:uncharacterized membrane protein YhaH (DUF805 family)|nr:DUF805 domain-containing protein [Xanthobacteraceae bacterium]